MKKLLSICLLLVTSLTLYADQIYQITDEKGRKTFTNVPPEQQNKPVKSIEKVQLKNTNIRENHLANDSSTEDSDESLVNEDNENNQAALNAYRQKLVEAENILNRAKANLEESKQIRGGDYFNLPNKGMRYKPEYLERVKQAELEVESAEAYYQQALNDKPSQHSPSSDDESSFEPQ